VEAMKGARTAMRLRDMVRMTMADMAELADERGDAYRLENADAWLAPAAHVIEATRAAVGDDRHNSYLPLRGLPELREAVAERLRLDYGLGYDPRTEVVITSGAGEAMLNALLALVNPGDSVLLTNPTYSGMAQRVRLVGGRQRFVDLDEDAGWRLPSHRVVRERGQGVRAVFFASPCMPTGTIFTAEETESLAAVARDEDAVLVFNASLDKMAFDGRTVVHPANLTGMKERTVTVGSVSKNYSMMGWRIGWVAGPAELVRPMEDVHIFNGIMPCGFAQAGAVAALTGDQGWQTETVERYQLNRDVILARLSDTHGLRMQGPEGGYFFLVNVKDLGRPSPEFARQLLEVSKVAVTPMVAWGRDDFGYDHVRVIFTNEPPARLEEAAELIRSFAAELDS
jgi:N-succinyldiaminopimelate aminotransferase